MDADESYWRTAYADESAGSEVIGLERARQRQAKKRAISQGFVFRAVDELAKTGNVIDLVERIETVEKTSYKTAEAEALLGGAQAPKVKVRRALDLYLFVSPLF